MLFKFQNINRDKTEDPYSWFNTDAIVSIMDRIDPDKTGGVTTWPILITFMGNGDGPHSTFELIFHFYNNEERNRAVSSLAEKMGGRAII